MPQNETYPEIPDLKHSLKTWPQTISVMREFDP